MRKIILLFILTTIGAIIFGLCLNVIFSGNTGIIWAIILTIISFSISIGSWAISQFLLEDRRISYLLSTIFVMTIAFFVPQNIYFYLCLAILLIVSFFAQNSIYHEKKARIKIMLDEVTASGAKMILVVFCLIFTLNFYYSPFSKLQDINISPNLENKILSFAIPGYSYNTTIDEMVWLLIIKDDDSLKNSIDRKQMIAQKMRSTSPEDFIQYKKALFDKIGLGNITLDGSTKVSESGLTNLIITDKSQGFINKYQNIIQFVLIILYYLVIIFSWKILYPIIYLYIWSVYKIMLSIKFIKIAYSHATTEKVEM